MLADIVGLFIIAVVALFVAYPLLEPRRSDAVRNAGDNRRDLSRQRDILLREIAELDFDHRLGKVTDADYLEQRGEYLDAAAEVLQQLDEREYTGDGLDGLDAAEDPIEREVRRLRLDGREHTSL